MKFHIIPRSDDNHTIYLVQARSLDVASVPATRHADNWRFVEAHLYWICNGVIQIIFVKLNFMVSKFIINLWNLQIRSLISFEMPQYQMIIQVHASPRISTRQLHRGMACGDVSHLYNLWTYLVAGTATTSSDLAYKCMHASERLLRILQRFCLCIQGLWAGSRRGSGFPSVSSSVGFTLAAPGEEMVSFLYLVLPSHWQLRRRKRFQWLRAADDKGILKILSAK